MALKRGQSIAEAALAVKGGKVVILKEFATIGLVILQTGY
jgi:hypothetical protein